MEYTRWAMIAVAEQPFDRPFGPEFKAEGLMALSKSKGRPASLVHQTTQGRALRVW